MERWIVKPLNMPAVIRNCSKCGDHSKFVCSGNFRVNANGKNLDVWLIYKCEKCETTWNMEILSRVKPEQIEKTLYAAFLKNDRDTAMHYAFDPETLRRNKAVVEYGNVTYCVEKIRVPGGCALEIFAPYDFGLRLDKLLSEELGLSRTKVKKLLEIGDISASGAELSSKTKVKETIRIKELNIHENQIIDAGKAEAKNAFQYHKAI